MSAFQPTPRETMACWCPDDIHAPRHTKTLLLAAGLLLSLLAALYLTQAPECHTTQTAIPAHCAD